MPQRLLARDPVCAPWRRHLRAHPVPRGQRVLLARLALAHATGAAPSPCLAALLRDMERASLEAGAGTAPRLHRRPRRRAARPARAARLRPLPDCGDVALGGVACARSHSTSAPSRSPAGSPGSPRATCPTSAPRLDEDARELALDGRRIALSKLECDVLRYLRDREGQAVARDALLRDVWGYEWTGGSNVVEVAVSGLRRKLGARARALETVRGVGYRLRPL